MEDLSINEMETIAEIVAEQILDIENCFPEHDEPFEDGSIPVENIKQLNQYLPIYHQLNPVICTDCRRVRSFRDRFFNNQFSPEITPPPPKFTA